MGSISRALLLAAALWAAGGAVAPAGAGESERGVFPGEEERKALGLLFREATLFLSPQSPPTGAGAIRVFLALKNPKNFSPRKVAGRAPRPPMDFLGWGLTARRGGVLSLAAFGLSGRFRGGASSPRERMPGALRKLLSAMVGRWPAPAAERLRAFAEIDRKRAEAMGLPLWEAFFARFRKEHAAAGRTLALPPARTVAGLPGPETAIKILGMILVIVVLSLFSVGFARQRRRRMREEMDKKFKRGNDVPPSHRSMSNERIFGTLSS
ncbi:MAG: hypothetical protein VCF07_14445 [Nitrospinota bacterium]